ncbi:BASS family bile acid:Na+ symporter [Corynebacterium freneyi]|uniref:BASS family bile acid:Na+ symporter n=2 Tax=Corynebacterium freneyi TaxID=134034 RepID=A0ABS4U9B0_9CORY|nr:BASS family bile acid:Na+ symporter [Corynebacterium freneyi]WJZ04779.1 Sodium Bile acid symporter family protein [Corynebacterium freneyi]
MTMMNHTSPHGRANEDAPVHVENKAEERSAAIAVVAFPAFILVGAVIAYFVPEPFVPIGDYITYALMVIMFCMGLTLTIPDLKLVARRPGPIAIGVVAQFVIMPLAAVAVAKMLGLNPMLAIGLLMLGSVPGGTASNVVAYLAKGDVALSVAMTSVSTLLSPIVTPIIMLLLAGEETPVDGGGIAWTLAKTVLIPVVGGLVIRVLFDKIIDKILPILPWLSILGIGAVVFPAVAKSAETLKTVGLLVIAAVILHNLFGYIFGYLAAKVFSFPPEACRTTAIEVATQSAGLASGMSGTFFSAEAAIPGAIAAVWHNVAGAIFAAGARRLADRTSADRT